MRSIGLMNRREEAIGDLVKLLSDKSEAFTKPKLVVIGGYALRAFVPFSRYSRDCDFVLQKGLEAIEDWIPDDVTIEAFEQNEDYGFMRWTKIFETGKRKMKLGVDFMEGEVRGREGEVFTVDDEFLERANRVPIDVGGRSCDVFVPSYEDFFLLKVMASRSSDIRDIAALVHENGVPENMRLEALGDKRIFNRNVKEKIIPEIEHKHFINSWKGMFVDGTFGEKDKGRVVKLLRELVNRNHM